MKDEGRSIEREFPILEFDPATEAVIEPSRVIKPRDMPEHCLLCFFQEAISAACGDGKAETIFSLRWEDAMHPIYELAYQCKRLALMHPSIVGPMSVVMLEQVIMLGCKKFIACGVNGELDLEIAVGHIL